MHEKLATIGSVTNKKNGIQYIAYLEKNLHFLCITGFVLVNTEKKNEIL